MNELTLFENKKDCCACGVCALVCPHGAITMRADEEGFVYPYVNEEKCISCGLCKKMCAFQNKRETNEPIKAYALARKDAISLKKSASGGVFAGLAEQWIEQGGVVFGASLRKCNGKLVPCHVSAQSKEELFPLLGSKYVKSDLGQTFLETKELLENGRKVLFSGTPCQIAALKNWLRKDYSELLTIDLVCHGVPDSAMFCDYIEVESKKIGHTIEDFRFRDKEKGWGMNAKLIYSEKGQQCSVCIPSNSSSFYELFLRGEIYRENCYSCPYANSHRPGDMTIGDYWGIEKQHPEYLKPEGTLDCEEGVSLLIINTKKGEEAFEKFSSAFKYYPSTFEKAAEYNGQLDHPSRPGSKRREILDLYRDKGYKAVDRWVVMGKKKEKIKDGILYHIHNDIPEPVRNIVKKIVRR